MMETKTLKECTKTPKGLWRERNRRTVEGIGLWDLVIYDIGNGIERGTVLDTYSDSYEGEIRTDSDGNISVSSIIYVVKGAGKQGIWDSSTYCKHAGLQKCLFDNYDLEINPTYLVLNAENKIFQKTA